VLVDGKHLVHRFHLDSTRGELCLRGAAEGATLRDRYEDILAFTEPGVNATQLGCSRGTAPPLSFFCPLAYDSSSEPIFAVEGAQ
jgi:hypothetical protein